MRANQYFSAALSTITAAIVGVILNLALWFSVHLLFSQTQTLQVLGLEFSMPIWTSLDFPALAIATCSLIAMRKFKLGMFKALAISAGVGVMPVLSQITGLNIFCTI